MADTLKRAVITHTHTYTRKILIQVFGTKFHSSYEITMTGKLIILGLVNMTMEY